MNCNRTSLLVSALSVVLGLQACSSITPEPKPPVVTQPAATVQPALAVQPPKPVETLQPTTFAGLPGWQEDDVRQAWPAFLTSCQVLVKKADWKEPCTVARDINPADEKAIRFFLESFFVPHRVANADGSQQGMVTGYYEPFLRGARKRGGPYQTPLHRVPDDLLVIDLSAVYPELKNMRLRGKVVGRKVMPYPSRADMEQSNALAGSEFLWVDDPIEAFFLQVQGSGRVHLPDSNETVRVAYAEQNGHPYKSIGRYLVDKGEMTLSQASAQSIKAWVKANPARQQELLNANPSYVFFREDKLPDPQKGPNGSLGVPLTPQRSIAIDPQFIPLGAPVYLATTRPNSDQPLQRLMVAQDTGGAIRGAVRADFFWGFGADAAENAGKMKQAGKMWVLLPKLPAPR
jgi:membrane-bound lytic murein transglycosylase A